jgi:hypothetical protein
MYCSIVFKFSDVNAASMLLKFQIIWNYGYFNIQIDFGFINSLICICQIIMTTQIIINYKYPNYFIIFI